MGNPARELHEIYSDWRSRAESSEQIALKTLVEPLLSDTYPRYVSVLRLLTRIDDVLRWMETSTEFRVALYRRQYAMWLAPAVAYPNGWSDNHYPETLVPQAILDQIEGFANYLDGKVPILGEDQEPTLRQLITRVRGALETDDSIDEALRVYVHQLLLNIEHALNDEVMGLAFDKAGAIRELWVALRAAEGASTNQKGVWRDLWVNITSGTVSSALVQGATIVLRAIVS